MKVPQVIGLFCLCLIIFSVLPVASGLPHEPRDINMPPVIDAIISGDLCDDGIATVTLSGADTYIWADNSTTENPRNFDLPPGTYSFDVTGFDNSDNSSATITVSFEIIESPSPIILPTDGLICEGNSLTLTALVDAGSTWEWSTGDIDAPTISVSPDTSTFYSITETNNGCTGTFQVLVSVQHPIAAPEITCGQVSTDSIQFIWNSIPNAMDYEISVLSGQAGIQQDDTTFIVHNLNPGETVDLEVTSLGTLCGGQTSVFSCTSDECFPLEIQLTPLEDICLVSDLAEFMLEVTVNDTTDYGQGFWAGPGITDPQAGTFDGTSAGAGSHKLFFHYEIGQCFYSDSLEVNIYETPGSDFSLSQDTVCQDASVMATYNSPVSPGLVFTWNFDSGASDLANDEMGPHEIIWDQPGTFVIDLEVADDHCSSQSDIQMVTVSPFLETPVITCTSPTTNAVTFTWDGIAGAIDYTIVDLDGPAGILNGTTYTVSGLSPGQTINIELTANSDGVCPSTMAAGSCQTNTCPEVTVLLAGPDTVCINEPVAFELTVLGSEDEFEINYQINNGPTLSANVNNNLSLPAFSITENVTLTILGYTNTSTPECQYTTNTNWTIVVNEPLTAGQPLDTLFLCANEPQNILLTDLLSGETPGGNWTETSIQPSSGNAFSPDSGIFNTSGQAAGVYQFTYTVTSPAPCPDDQKEVFVVIAPVPLADAGQDQQLACDVDVVTLDGSNSASGPDVAYQWIPPNGVTLENPSNITQQVEQAGLYVLHVTNSLGCRATDEVVVTAVLDNPEAAWTAQDLSCYDANDGMITIETITGGSPPYSVTFNGEIQTGPTTFPELSPGTYTLDISDANLCNSQYFITIEEPEEIEVNLFTYPGNTNTFAYGDTVQLSLQYAAQFPIDTIIWRPANINANGQSSITINALASTSYSIMVIDENGCLGEDQLNIFVEKSRPVYIPNVFSPNNDGINDFFYIQGTDGVTLIKAMSVFDRWGNHVFSAKDILPNDIGSGWNGNYKGQKLPPGVYTFYAEIEFKSGDKEIFSGSLTLVR